MNWLKELMLFTLLVQFLKVDFNIKVNKIKKKNPYHDKYIPTTEFNNLMKENFAARLKKQNQ